MQIKTLWLIFLCFGCGMPAHGRACEQLASLRWLLGEWTGENEQRITTETWQAVSATTFEGLGQVTAVASGEITSRESLRLVEMTGGIFYLAKVAHNELPVAFKLTECDANRAVFENATHDFPRRLEYRRTAESRLRIRVSDGGANGFTLELTKDE